MHMYRQLECNSERARAILPILSFQSKRKEKKQFCPWPWVIFLGFGLVEILGIFAWLAQVVAVRSPQGKKFRTVNPVYQKIYRYRLCPRNEFRRNFEFFGFKIQKFKKIHKKQKPDFPTGFRCFPVGFRCFPVGKHCFSNVKKYFGIYGIAKELLHMYI